MIHDQATENEFMICSVTHSCEPISLILELFLVVGISI